MAETGKPVLELIREILGPLTKTKWGTKFLGLLAADGVIGYLGYLAMQKVTTDWPMVGVVAAAGLAVLITSWCYYSYRDKQEERENGGDS